MLARDAFGDFRKLIEDVTLHPMMGVYLSMLGNQKPNAGAQHPPRRELRARAHAAVHDRPGPAQPRRHAEARRARPADPDLRPGRHRRVRARVHGLELGVRRRLARQLRLQQHARRRPPNQILPMQAFAEQHAPGAKQLLAYPGAAQHVAARPGQTAAQDLADALDNIFNHPNVGPFIARQLIQKLVTSNPSPGVRAARERRVRRRRHRPARQSGRGRARDPARRRSARRSERRDAPASSRSRCCGSRSSGAPTTARPRAASTSNINPADDFGQGPLQAPSVFNFFSPFYAPPGEIADQGLVAPELQIATEYQNTLVANYFYSQVVLRATRRSNVTNPRHRRHRHRRGGRARRRPRRAGRERRREAARRPDVGHAARASRAAGRRASPRRTRRSASPKRSGSSRLRPNSPCSAEPVGSRMNRTDRIDSTPISPRRRGRRRRLCLRPHAGRHVRADGRRRLVRRLQGARLRVPVRRQRLLEHGRAVERRRARGVCRLAPESRGRARTRLLPLQSGGARPERLVVRIAPRDAGPRGAVQRGPRGGRRERRPAVAPTTLAQYQDRSVPLPPQLFSHNDQQDQWHSLKGNAPSKSGWAGRIADVLARACASQQLALNVSLAGQTLFQAGATAVPYTMGARGPARRSRVLGTGLGSARRQAFQSVAERELRDGLRASVRRRAAARAAVRRYGQRRARGRARARVAAEQSVARAVEPRDAAAHRREAHRRARSAANVAADLLRRDRRVRHARRPGRGPAGAARRRERRAQALRRRDAAARHRRTRSSRSRSRTSGARSRRTATARITRGAACSSSPAAPWPAAASTASIRCCASARAAARIEPTTSAAGGSFRRFRPISTRRRSRAGSAWRKPTCRTIAPSIDNFAARNLGFLI